VTRGLSLQPEPAESAELANPTLGQEFLGSGKAAIPEGHWKIAQIRNFLIELALCISDELWHQSCYALPKRKNKSMSIEQNATQWVETMLQGQTRATKQRQSVARSRRVRKGTDRPLNILGCLALIHAVRSIDAGERIPVRARRTIA
jgi:hypothetical protein